MLVSVFGPRFVFPHVANGCGTHISCRGCFSQHHVFCDCERRRQDCGEFVRFCASGSFCFGLADCAQGRSKLVSTLCWQSAECPRPPVVPSFCLLVCLIGRGFPLNLTAPALKIGDKSSSNICVPQRGNPLFVHLKVNTSSQHFG